MESWREINLATFASRREGEKHTIFLPWRKKPQPLCAFFIQCNSSKILQVCILPNSWQLGVPPGGQQRGRDVEEDGLSVLMLFVGQQCDKSGK